MSALRSLRTALAWALIAAAFGAIAAWLAFSAACLYDDDLPLCRHPAGGWIVMIGAVVAVFAPLALVAMRRARRGLGRGMYARVAGVRQGRVNWQLLESVGRLIIEGEWHSAGTIERSWHPADVPTGYGWRVALEDGAQVIVFFDDFRQWLYVAWELEKRAKVPQQGATSQRTWDKRIGRDQVLARNYLLEMAGGLRRNRAAPNATRRIDGTPWSILERLIEIWPPSAL